MRRRSLKDGLPNTNSASGRSARMAEKASSRSSAPPIRTTRSSSPSIRALAPDDSNWLVVKDSDIVPDCHSPATRVAAGTASFSNDNLFAVSSSM